MSQKREIRWLYDQLPDWVEQGLINRSQAEALRERYGPVDERSSASLAFILIGVLGVLLVSGGILLIIAYNWDQLSRASRTVLSFAPLVLAQAIYGYAFFRRRESTAWIEGSSTFLLLMIGATLALISQTYNIGGAMDDYLFNWALLSIPLLYLQPSSAAALLYLFGISWWLSQAGGNERIYYWFFLAAAVPHLILFLKRNRSAIRRNLLGWGLGLSFFFSWWWVIEAQIPAYSFIGSALALAIFYLLGQRLYPDSQNLLHRPLRTLSVLGIYVFLLVLTFEFAIDPTNLSEVINGDRYSPWAGRINFFILAGLFLSYIGLFLSRFNTRGLIDLTVWMFPFLILFYLMLEAGEAQETARLLANAYALGLGVVYLISGLGHQHLGRVNLGLIFILILAGIRFFETDWSAMVKGLAFVLLGCGFLAANLVLSRRLRQSSNTGGDPYGVLRQGKIRDEQNRPKT